MSRMSFQDIPMFPRAIYEIDVMFRDLPRHVAECVDQGLDLDPDFQRGHVWTRDQQVAYVEYMLRGGEVSRTIIVNAPRWNDRSAGGYEGSSLVDGKQRLRAIVEFMENRLPIFGGHFLRDFDGHMRLFNGRVQWRVVCLESRRDLLDLYLNINAGGTPHTAEEIGRVLAMREALG